MDSLFDAQDLALWRKADPRFLSFYGDDGIRLALERYGFAREAAKRGFADLRIETRNDEHRHTLLVYGVPVEGGEPQRLAEAVVRRDRLLPHGLPGLPELEKAYQVLTVDWLVLQNPRARFTPERPRLPGQEAPGLGLGEQVFELLCRATERLKLDGMVSTAEYFHNAVLYVSLMPFLDPRCAGELQALMRVLLLREQLNLAQASWAVHWGLVTDLRRSRPFRWHGELQVWPRSPTLKAYLDSDAYFRRVGEATVESDYELDRRAFDERWQLERDALEGRSVPPVVSESP